MRASGRLRILVALLGFALAAAACGDSAVSDGEEDAASSTTSSTERSTTTVAATTTTTTTEASTTSETGTDTSTAADQPDDPAPTGSGCGAEVETGRSTVGFRFEGRDRVYELFVPPSYDPDVPTPLVMNWHGLGSNGPDQLRFSEYVATATDGGFLVVAPTGVPSPGDTNNSWELTDDIDPTRDDMAFAEIVLDRIIASHCVDETRVYTTGMSNGGYFSARLICELADRIAAASSVAALAHPDDCEPTRPVPYIGFHGVDDAVVPYDGGGFSSLAPGVRIELFELVIPDEFAEFAVAYGCDPTPSEQTISDDVTAFVYGGCPDGVEAVFYRLDNAGHTWPGSTVSLAIGQQFGLGVTNTDINATELSWEFFQRHSLG